MQPGAKPETGDKNSQEPWWTRVGNASAEISGLNASGISGDFIVANVGAGSKNVAVGKGITQTVYEIVGEPTPDDKAIITEKLSEVEATLATDAGAGGNSMLSQMAQFQLKLLTGELSKVAEGEIPSAITITQIGDWLLDNLPGMAETLTSLFATPAVGRVVGKAGEAAIAWLRQRFGGG